MTPALSLPEPSGASDGAAPASTGWTNRLAARMAAIGLGAGGVWAVALVLALLAAACLLWSGAAPAKLRAVLLFLAVVLIQFRMTGSRTAGLLARDHGLGDARAAIWSEIPDRLADLMILVGAGYGAERAGIDGAGALGWLAAVLALLGGHVRLLGVTLGFRSEALGPMGATVRMAVLSAACIVSMFEPLWGWRGPGLVIGLSIIALGAAITLGRRIVRLAGRLGKTDEDA